MNQYFALRTGGDALQRSWTGSAPAAASGWSADLCWQRRWCHRVGCPEWGWVWSGVACPALTCCSIHVLLPIMPHSLCLSEVYLRLHFDPSTFDVSAMMHPSTYLNKVLLGSSQGALQLWNIKTRWGCSARLWTLTETHIQKSPESLSDFRFPSMSLWWSLCKTCIQTPMTQLPSACSKEPRLSQLVGLSLLQKYLLLQHAVKNKLF